jgi:transcriptional regulator with XRE-family HTH domain
MSDISNRPRIPASTVEARNFGDMLRGVREECGVSMGDAARSLGVSASELSDWELGYALPSGSQLAHLWSAFGIIMLTMLGVAHNAQKKAGA